MLVMDAEGVREVLVAKRERVLERVAAMEREFAGLAEAASSFDLKNPGGR